MFFQFFQTAPTDPDFVRALIAAIYAALSLI